MKNISVEKVNWNESLFHFAPKANIESIDEKGLIAQIGDASKLKEEKEARVYMSKGFKGILAIKNSFIYEWSHLRICDIPIGYRKYFSIDDFSSEKQIPIEEVYSAMEKRMKDEVYFVVDAKEGEDYLDSETKSTFGGVHDVNGIANHNIAPEKLSMIVTESGTSAYDVVKYLYYRLLEKNPDKVDVIKSMNSSLCGMFDFIEKKDKQASFDLSRRIINETVKITELQTTTEIINTEVGKIKSLSLQREISDKDKVE